MGLNEEEVIKSRNQNGSNALVIKRNVSFFGKLIKNLGDPIIRILIVAFFVTLLFSGGEGNLFEALGIAASVVISTLVSTVSEYGSEKAFRKMQLEAMRQTCEVIRGGKYVELPVEELVLGDCVSLKSGDKVGADGELISGEVSVDMSAINGESAEQHKSAMGKGESSELYRGSVITAGKGIMRVSAVGGDSFYGRIASEVQDNGGDSPLREKLSALAKTLSKFGYFCAVIVALAYLTNVFFLSGEFVYSVKNVIKELLSAFTLGISVVVVAVPEGLPMMITVVLSSNMIRMQKQNIRVRKPVGIETAGSVDILFTDKTGTLTYGEAKTVCYVTGNGVRSQRSVDLSPSERFLLGMAAVHASESRVENEGMLNKRKAVGGNTSERAVLNEYLESGDYPRGTYCQELLAFDSKIKLSAATVSLKENREYSALFGETLTVIKGAPEILLKYCNSSYRCDGRRQKLDKESLSKHLEHISSKGIRALAVITTSASPAALKKANRILADGGIPEVAELMSEACFVCFVGMRDELRRESPKAIKTFREAGIQTVMITGDSKTTAVAIARECGILEGGSNEVVLESSELKAMSDSEIADIIPSLRVVARALPDDKSRLVRIAKSRGRITAMTGDGLNDAPALKAADVGFAMGNGTEVAKESGDIIINDSNISSIEKAVLYGRTVFRSIRKFIVFQLIMNLSAVGISVIGPFIRIESPVTVMQMLWINLIMDTIAAIAFAGEAPLMRYMKAKPTPKNEPVLNGDMITRIFVMGVFSVMLCLYYCNSAKISALFGGKESPVFMSGFFALFVFCGIFGAFNARSGRINILSGLFQNPVFVTVMAAVFCAQVAMIYFGGELFRCVPLTVEQLIEVIKLSITVIPAGILLEALMKIGVKRRETSLLTVAGIPSLR